MLDIVFSTAILSLKEKEIMKNYRVLPKCLRCRHSIEVFDISKDDYETIICCNVNQDVPGFNVINYKNIMLSWQKEHQVADDGICDIFEGISCI